MALRMLFLVACGELLGMTLWFSATAVTPALIAELRLNSGQAAWLTMSVQAGFVGGTLVSALLNLPDVLNARRLFALGCCIGAIANAAIAWADGPIQVIVLRGVTGIALAAVYPPGMKIVASWFQRRRGTALGIVTGALTLGSAFPHLLAWVASAVPWQRLMWTASALAVIGGVLVWLAARDGPHAPPTSPFDARAAARVFIDRGTRLATLGYLGHMWELYAMWTWMAVFVAAAYEQRGVEDAVAAAARLTFVTIGSGAAGCVVAGFLADRFGRARVATLAMVASGSCAAGAGFVFGAPVPVLYAFAIFWGVTIVADSAQFSALVTQYAPRDHLGTALTMQMCAGFLLTMVTIRLLPAAAAVLGWQWVFLLLSPGPVIGALAMGALSRRPPVESASLPA